MTEVIGIKFKADGRVYSFAPNGVQGRPGMRVIVETARGVECGEVATENRSVPDEQIVKPLKKVLRAADENDLRRLAENEEKAKNALAVCEKKIAAHKLDMKLVDVEYAFDGSKILFYFLSDGRVDFRELVRDLASTFHTRIELRQIGVRDEAKILGGLGICGQPFCCARFLDDFQPVSIKMAKEQGLSLNPTKISGACGRLMCCLKYEQDAYEYLASLTPEVGALVQTADGAGVVTEANLVTGALYVRLNDSDAPPVKFHRDDVTLLSHGKRRRRSSGGKSGGEKKEKQEK